jgi:hypothetical protein
MALCCHGSRPNSKDRLDAITIAQLHGNTGPLCFAHVSHLRYPLARKGPFGLILDALPKFLSRQSLQRHPVNLRHKFFHKYSSPRPRVITPINNHIAYFCPFIACAVPRRGWPHIQLQTTTSIDRRPNRTVQLYRQRSEPYHRRA